MPTHLRAYRHELCRVVGITHSSDNGRHEQGDGVERGVDSNGDEHVDPNLPILKGVPKELHIKFISEGAPIQLQASRDFALLIVVQELRRFGVIMHDEEGTDSCFYFVSTTLRGVRFKSWWENVPMPKVRIPSRMKIQAQPFLPPTPSISAIPRARRPPKAPAAVAAEKKTAIRRPHSCLRYHIVMLVFVSPVPFQ